MPRKVSKKLATEKTSTLGRPRSFNGVYDPYDPRTKNIEKRAGQIKALASIGASKKSAASQIGVSDASIRMTKMYKDAYDEGRAIFQNSIRAKQVEKGFKGDGDTTMLIHLGKVYCEDQRKMGDVPIDKEALEGSIDSMLERSEKVIALEQESITDILEVEGVDVDAVTEAD